MTASPFFRAKENLYRIRTRKRKYCTSNDTTNNKSYKKNNSYFFYNFKNCITLKFKLQLI